MHVNVNVFKLEVLHSTSLCKQSGFYRFLLTSRHSLHVYWYKLLLLCFTSHQIIISTKTFFRKILGSANKTLFLHFQQININKLELVLKWGWEHWTGSDPLACSIQILVFSNWLFFDDCPWTEIWTKKQHILLWWCFYFRMFL